MTADTHKIREKISQISMNIGLTESRIIEECVIYGYCVLYGEESDIPDMISIMKKRHGNIFDENKFKDILKAGQQMLRMKNSEDEAEGKE